MRLVDTLDEQADLERLLESSKPALPAGSEGLHWLLTTPFRYPPLPSGSRFRAANQPGVFYGADERRTACAELGYWRWRFLTDSPSLGAMDGLPQTLFRASCQGLAIDLRAAPFDRDVARWNDPVDYGPCQAFAATVRSTAVELIRYASVRDPLHAGCAAVLTPAAFVVADLAEQAWLLTVTRARVFWHRSSAAEPETFQFDAAAWPPGPASG
jgi:hypothetical protein